MLLDSTLLACSSTSQSTHASRVGGGCARTTVACVLEGDEMGRHHITASAVYRLSNISPYCHEGTMQTQAARKRQV